MLEDKNILINQEATRTVHHLIRICKVQFPQARLKHIITLLIDKMNMKKKTSYNTVLTNIIDDVLIFRCMPPEMLCDLLLNLAETNKNMNTRIASLSWFVTNFSVFLTEKQDLLTNICSESDNKQLDKVSISTNVKNNKSGAFITLKPDERVPRLISTILKRVQQILKKE